MMISALVLLVLVLSGEISQKEEEEKRLFNCWEPFLLPDLDFSVARCNTSLWKKKEKLGSQDQEEEKKKCARNVEVSECKMFIYLKRSLFLLLL